MFAAQTFSHVHTHGMDKRLPRTMCTDDIRSYDPQYALKRALKTPVIVLVAGDVAQTVSAEGERSARFLYAGMIVFFNRGLSAF